MSDTPWRPARPTVLLLGALTLWPLVYVVIFVAAIAWILFGDPGAGGTGGPVVFKVLFPLHLLTMLLIFALMAVYVTHAYRTDGIPPDRKVLWVVILFFGNMVVFPVYWYFYLWRAPAPETAPGEQRA